MKTAISLTSVVLAMVFCASAFADPNKGTSGLPKQQAAQKSVRKLCYTVITGSAIPQPCDRLSVIPTTAIPMDHVGGYSVTTR